MQKMIATLVFAIFLASMFACKSQKLATRKETSGTIMDSVAHSTPPTIPHSPKQ